MNAEQVTQMLQGPPDLADPWRLRPRERALMWLLIWGMSVQEAAEHVGVATKTAERHMHDARGRMGLRLRGTHLLRFDRWLRCVGLHPIQPDGPWDLTPGQQLLLDTFCKAGCHKLTARRLQVAESTVRKQFEYIRQRMLMVGTPSIVPVLMWDRWRNPDGYDPLTD